METKRMETIYLPLVDTYTLALEDRRPWNVQPILEDKVMRDLGVSRDEAKAIVTDTMLQMGLWN